jgi:hypothetical protein
MARGRHVEDPNILRMALVGYQVEKEKIEDRILEIKSLLNGKKTSLVSDDDHRAPAKRNLSDAARRRIAAAQKKRWAEHRRLKALQAGG